MAELSEKKSKDQKEVLDTLQQIGSQNGSVKNSLVYNESTGEFEVMSSTQSIENDPDRILINEIGEKGWAI